MFERIAGYPEVKEELIRIREWVTNRENLQGTGIKLPRGIVFYGGPGNGKTLFLREFALSFGYPIITIESDGRHASERIHEAFEKSRENPYTIILIDEIDLLLGGPEDERALRSELDGVDSNPNALVLATTNHLSFLGRALTRNGRFDRTICIESPNRESRESLLAFYAEKLGLEGEVDYAYLSRIMTHVSCAQIEAIVNDVCLRGGKQATTEDYETSYRRIAEGDCSPRTSFNPASASAEVAYHEVAHALLVYKNRKTFAFYEASYRDEGQSGRTLSFPVDERSLTADFYEQDIEISLAGHVMTKLKFRRLDGGCIDDLQKSRDDAVRLVNKLGYIGPQYVLPRFCKEQRMETEIRKRRNEKAIERIIHQAEKRVRKYLKAHMKEADILAKTMMEKGYINAADLNRVMEGNDMPMARPAVLGAPILANRNPMPEADRRVIQ